MKASEGRLGRVFVIRFEDSDQLPECIERFAEEKGVTTGHVILVGGIGGGRVVVGPENSEERPPSCARRAARCSASARLSTL